MRWKVSLTTSAVFDGTRPWTDIASAVLVELDLIGVLETPVLSRADDHGLRLDAALDAAGAAAAYQLATQAGALALRAAGVGLIGWSTVLVVTRPVSPAPEWTSEPDPVSRPAEW
jgi:hypothetical protein